ncbi:CPBP family intramembrane metalloprotease [Maribacter algarum]|uniref:CPBP family intramembrane metalloprotease n=1 Tax=Maribacter algarum (ex Zhang et al. 2020) TaxID=2578118 RepID=A0A5S3PUU4_9FLAO|nr:type II CAAX endopeptidase family protein [Maribacter algarum]TMM57962.1 CPBP family intramembrane metalloprotease [Maribacter algarum]
MKNQFIQTTSALILPISFMGILFLLSAVSIGLPDKYELGGVMVTGIALFMTFLVLRKDKKTFKDIGYFWERKTPIRFAYGFLIGIVITGFMLFLLVNFSNLQFRQKTNPNILSAVLWLLAFFPLALMEEIIFRGYAFIKINENVGLWPAQILLALLFAWYHDFTGLTFFNQLLGPGIWALIYGIAAVWSKGLALPTGIHMAINVVLALFGQKDDRHAIWNLAYDTEITPILHEQTENVGLVMQMVILLIGIILTECYRRKMIKTRS